MAQMRTCNKCHIEMDLAAGFARNGRHTTCPSKDRRHACRKCEAKMRKEWRDDHKEAIAQYQHDYRIQNIEKNRAYRCKNYHKHRDVKMVAAARRRAKQKGLAFSITVDDVSIPEYCPVLGIKIKHNYKKMQIDSSPTIDRCIPELGYVRGNVRVISWRANRLKSNATPEELALVAAYAARSAAEARKCLEFTGSVDEAKQALERARRGERG
jgi:hypothetical protein